LGDVAVVALTTRGNPCFSQNFWTIMQSFCVTCFFLADPLTTYHAVLALPFSQ